MSSKWSGYVWDLDLPRDEKIVLMAMADQANHDGTNMFYGVELLSYMTDYSARAVRGAIAGLLKRGILKVTTRGGGRGRLTIYEADVDLILRLARKRPRKGAGIAQNSSKRGKTIQQGNSAESAQNAEINSERIDTETVQDDDINSERKGPDGLYVRNQQKDPPHQPPSQPSEEDQATAANLIAEREGVAARLERMTHDKDPEKREAAGCFRREVAYGIAKEGSIVLTECLSLLNTALKDGGVRRPVAYLLQLIENHAPRVHAQQASGIQPDELTEMAHHWEEERKAKEREHNRRLIEDPAYQQDCVDRCAWRKALFRTKRHNAEPNAEERASASAEIMRNVPDEEESRV